MKFVHLGKGLSIYYVIKGVGGWGRLNDYIICRLGLLVIFDYRVGGCKDIY